MQTTAPTVLVGPVVIEAIVSTVAIAWLDIH